MAAIRSGEASGLARRRQSFEEQNAADQLAMSQRATVYMVFVPGSFWNDASGNFNNSWWNALLTFAERNVASNLCDKQFSGYTFVSLRTMGDQPGQGAPHYLTRWQTLPEGTFIATNKFGPPGTLLSVPADRP